jgi:hypothetical protein
MMSKNPNAILVIEEHLEEHLNHLNWYFLSQNINIFSLLNKPHIYSLCKDRINWYSMCENPYAIPFLEKHTDKIPWHWLSGTQNAFHFLEKHLDNYLVVGKPGRHQPSGENPR